MSYKYLRRLAAARQWANTEQGEKVIVRVLGIMTLVLAVDVCLFIAGVIKVW